MSLDWNDGLDARMAAYLDEQPERLYQVICACGCESEPLTHADAIDWRELHEATCGQHCEVWDA